MSFGPVQYTSPYVSEQQVLKIKQAFELFDPDLGGVIDFRELKRTIKSLGMEAQAQYLYRILEQMDKEYGTGVIQFDQFFYLMTTRPSDYNQSREEIHNFFATFDTERKGYINLIDLRRLSKQQGQIPNDDILIEMIEVADKDGDGLICQEQFYNLMTKKAY